MRFYMNIKLVSLAAITLCASAESYFITKESGPSKTVDQRGAAFALPSDKVFPHMATGGGWETTLVLVNMGTRAVSFDQRFYDTQGRPMEVTFRAIPSGQPTTTARATGVLEAGSSFNVLLYDRGQPLQIGWSQLVYDSTSDRLGGYEIFRSFLGGGLTFEALVPLSATDDYKFYLPFDNREGFVTSMALLNGGAGPTTVSLTFRSTAGVVLTQDTVVLPAGNQTAFSIPGQYAQTRGQVGTLYVTGSSNFLSSLGFRFNGAGGFATIPIMNWPGMFP